MNNYNFECINPANSTNSFVNKTSKNKEITTTKTQILCLIIVYTYLKIKFIRQANDV